MHPDACTHLYITAHRTSELGEAALRDRLVREAADVSRVRAPSRVRRRLGWTLVEVGLRLATPVVR